MKTIFQNSLYSFSLMDAAKPVLLFEWTDKTSAMSYEDFQSACNNYAGFAWQHQAKHLLVDTCQFHFRLPEEFNHWREHELNLRYHSLGVMKFAYVTKPEFLQYMTDIPAENGKFGTRNFASVHDAYHWLTNEHDT